MLDTDGARECFHLAQRSRIGGIGRLNLPVTKQVHHAVHHSPIAENANEVPGFPQDAFMEMGMDEAVAKPETYGLPPNWSAGMMGMMTMVRVLPDNEYGEIQARIREKQPAPKTEHVHSN